MGQAGMAVRAGVLLSAITWGGCGEGTGPQPEQAVEDFGVSSQAIVYGGHDYLFVTTPKTWQEANSICKVSGYELVTLNDVGEEGFLQTHESRLGLYNWWIGLNDLGQEGFFVWSGGASNYWNFASGEPNNDGGEHCVADRYQWLPSITSEQWNDWPCGRTFPFICEKAQVPEASNGRFEYSASSTSNGTVNTSNYSIYLRAGQLFVVGTCGVAGASNVGDTYLRINGPNGQEVASNDDISGACGTASNISIVVPTSGNYVIKAGCYSSSSCGGVVAYSYSS
ncbi:C-type lectin domain-containing protein [Myxococcus sp. AM011]|uniref:C-type lectin domain-containing protein n=1 Tax=Myxococcus sp. AM011 TaxID=2745200 RepID=UPI0015957F13|nr:C-type lectin domain-containing protein [Myxococcus sp. AM011]NVJ19720.1 C-type lectin domain-containing protein [Myxococcus sp. AM011]